METLKPVTAELKDKERDRRPVKSGATKAGLKKEQLANAQNVRVENWLFCTRKKQENAL